ncbi:MAG: NAD(+)/NADH kinase, partial [Planctomycetota bacterium]
PDPLPGMVGSVSLILLTTKVSSVAHLSHEEIERLEQASITTDAALREREARHIHSLDQVRQALTGEQVRERRVDELVADDIKDVKLVVTVGGDGTVLAVASLLKEIPVIAVNSDPERSVGHFTRCLADDFARLLAGWRDNQYQVQPLPRLELCLNEQPQRHLILNDCLVTNCNPAAMTRYRICWDDTEEQQASSGVWVSTAAGSTAAIHSAGAEPVPADQDALLFQVREPYEGHRPVRLRGGRALPPRPLTLTAAMPGIRCYIDGSHYYQSLPAGATAHFTASAYPLRLLSLPSA